ncbi:MAG TPA: hypothetical protein PLJ27_06615 [Polyangiaceae bacterium]|jgi:hypothetical protein|nr:MAG: hypothetical protein BWY17_04625 [Deltaproteobacteria bacterium ADurb.Bin207]HNS97955.1 hypothetical protein [Polyangiaceae bacterium]HNZ25146.1 hypothetical protein [Polyangiaceae bacterium]HOD24135.1 hypothetical protein [Polyangiaceae bacterium]HOE51329.1 hypothetical protein [Polyangiaceae bacterium]
MSVRRIVAVCAALLCFGFSHIARAQSDTTVHAVGNIGFGYTDNMFGTPSEPPPGQPGPVGVWMLELSPGLAIIHDSPRAIHTLTYAHPFTIYLGHSDSVQQSDVGAWNGLFTLSPRDELILGLSVERSNTRLGNLHAGAEQTTAASQLTGDNMLLQTRLSQLYSHEFSGQWRMTQNASAGAVIPLLVPTPQPNRYEVTLGAGPDYTTGRNAYGFSGEATYFFTSEVNEGGLNLESAAQIVMTGVFRWRHDLTETWSTELNGGFAGALRADPVRGGLWGPIALAAVRYASEGYDASLSIERSLGPDLLTARTVMADHVLLAGGVPIDQEHNIILRTGTGYSHSRSLEVAESGFLVVAPFATPKSTDDARLVTTFDTFVLDASIGWYPEDLPFVELRYQHLEQIGEQSQIAPAATFHRNMGMLSMGMMWPTRETPRVPQREPSRVDDADRDMRLSGPQADGMRSRGSRPRND